MKETEAYQKGSSIAKDIKKEPQQDKSEEERYSLTGTHNLRFAIYKQEEYHNHRGPSPGDRGFSSHINSIFWSDTPPECLALKTRGAYIQENRRLCKQRLRSQRVHTKSHLV